MDDIPPEQPAAPTRGSAPAPASHRLRLEVDLLAAAESSPPPAPPDAAFDVAGDAVPRSVLVAVGEPDLGSYVLDCLRAYGALRIVVPDAGEHALAAARRLRPALLITEPAAVGTPPPLPVPLLLLVEDLPESTPIRPPPAAPLAFLLLPFNARRLLDAVEPLLGPPGDHRWGGRPSDPQPP